MRIILAILLSLVLYLPAKADDLPPLLEYLYLPQIVDGHNLNQCQCDPKGCVC